jgi:SPP1 gp7 family putative phage head morphogenesis protein
MHTLMANYLTTKASQYAALAKATTSKAEEDEEEKRKAQLAAYLEAIDAGEISWDDLPVQVEAVLKPMAEAGAQDALKQLEITSGIDFDVVNEAAVAWAKDRSAELVGMKYVDGELVPNPRAEWSIEETTRDTIRDLVAQATEEGWSMDDLASRIASDAAFSDERAMTIARTESATADVQGNMTAYREARDQIGVVVMKEWITAGDDLVSEDCAGNGEQGPIDLDDEFQSGASAPPEHPNCRCDVLPVRFPTDEEAGSGDEGE